MDCFEHPSKPAIGLCRSCNKGICKDCAKIFSKGMACCDECLKDAKELVEMNERAKKLYGIGVYKANRLSTNVLIYALLSAAMWAIATFSFVGEGTPDYGTLCVAVLFSIITIVVYRGSKRTGLQC